MITNADRGSDNHYLISRRDREVIHRHRRIGCILTRRDLAGGVLAVDLAVHLAGGVRPLKNGMLSGWDVGVGITRVGVAGHRIDGDGVLRGALRRVLRRVLRGTANGVLRRARFRSGRTRVARRGVGDAILDAFTRLIGGGRLGRRSVDDGGVERQL